jgi:hypothetical protein
LPEDEALVEAATTAFREGDARGIRFHPAWYDLDADGRRAAFEATTRSRRLEAATDPEGLSTTARAVLARIRGAGG